jgi:hypothetical protein
LEDKKEKRKKEEKKKSKGKALIGRAKYVIFA